MTKDEYSPYKIIHHYDKLDELISGFQPVPILLHIVPTNRCNHACSFCAYRMQDHMSNETFDNREELSESKLLEILDSAYKIGVKAVNFSGGGEPLLHPQIKSIMERSLSYFDTSLITNGALLNKEMCQTLEHLSWCRISLDAANPKTYRMIRHVSEQQMHVVLNNIETFLKYRGDCTVGIGFVATKTNYREIYEATKLAKAIGVDNIRLGIVYDNDGLQEWMFTARALAKEAAELSDDNFTVFNTIKEKVSDISEGTQDYDKCYIKDLQAYIGADGNVYMCCTYAYNKKGLIGSLEHQTFEDLWESQDKEMFYAAHSPRVHCQIPCQYKSRNEFIGYCVKVNPKHVNFI